MKSPAKSYLLASIIPSAKTNDCKVTVRRYTRTMRDQEPSRRELLTRRSTRSTDRAPQAGGTLRLNIHAMACDFGAAVNPGQTDLLLQCGEALEVVSEIESWLSPWRSDSEVSRLNACPVGEHFPTSAELLNILLIAAGLYDSTEGAFDIVAGAQVELWKRCRAEERLPGDAEIQRALAASGTAKLAIDRTDSQVSRKHAEAAINPGAIGKGHALDRTLALLKEAGQADDLLLHGGRSSLMARGRHADLDGWPIGIGNPLLTNRRLGTVILRNQAMSTSGSNIQFFRCEGRRFGHILDPRTGWPVDGMLSATVLADSAAVADALSTAFFVLGVEKAIECCDTIENVGAVLIPFPVQGAKVEPILHGISDDQVFWDEELVLIR